MIKKYVIAIDSPIPFFKNDDLKMFICSESTIFDTIEAAEKRVAEILITKPEGDKTICTILPVYLKK